MTNKGKVIKKALQGIAKVFNKNYDKLEIAPFSLEQVLKADDDVYKIIVKVEKITEEVDS